MKRLTLLLVQFWQTALIGLVLILFIFGLLFFRLGSKPAALSASEVTTRYESRSLHSILKNPINAPLTIPEHFFIKFKPYSKAASRAVPVLYGIITLILFFAVLKFWQDTFTAVIGTLLFGTSSWFFHTARLDTPNILLFGVIAILAAGLWLKHTLRRNLLIVICALTIAVAIYIPGLIWFIIVGISWSRRSIIHELKHTKLPVKIIACLVFLALSIPLALALVKQPALARMDLGLPTQFPRLEQIGHNFLAIPIHLFIRGPLNPVGWLGRIPILNFFEDAMLAVGLYAFWEHRHLYRSQLLSGVAIIGAVLISLGGPTTITILLPIIYIIIATGILYMLEAWQSVFPFNPVARSFGKALLIIVVLLSCNYQLQSYFEAWQNSPATQAVFTQKATKV